MLKKPTILYDPQIFDIQNYGGISRYFANLIQGIQITDTYNAKLPILYSSNYYIRRFPQLMKGKIGQTLLKGKRKRTKWNQFYAVQQTRKTNYDILHATYYDPYILEHLQRPLVITVHDMIYENYPDLFPESPLVISQKKTMIGRADLIIAVSEYTKSQILRHYPLLSTPIRVVYHSLPDSGPEETNIKIPQKFLLYVGDRNAAYKNFERLLEAIVPIFSMHQDLHLICVGGGDLTQAEQELFSGFGLTGKINQVNASDGLLKHLYKHAEFLIYPSIEEGFGFPLLEAFVNGCPVACSDCSSLHEVGGDAPFYFDPLNTVSIKNTVEELLSSPELKEDRVRKGFERAKLFSFQETLSQTQECYKLLL